MDRHLTQDLVKYLFHYNPITGEFTRKVSRGNTKAGSIVSGCNAEGYICTQVGDVQYKLHRLVFLYMTGEFPPEQVDHINRDKLDNSWKNLRLCSHFDNQQNKTTSNSTVGVHKDTASNKWRASFYSVKSKRYTTHLAACYARHYMELTLGV